MFETISRLFGTDEADSTEPPDEWQEDQTTLGQGPRPEGGTEAGSDDEPDVEDLEVRLAELDEDLESTESSLRTLRDTQEEMAESMAEVNDTVRQLVGVYDRLAAEDNPFVDGPEAGTHDNPSPIVGDGTATPPGTESNEDPTESPDAHSRSADGEVVSFGDLGDESTDDPDPERSPEDVEREGGTGRDPDRFDSGQQDWVPASSRIDDDPSGPLLESVPNCYAGDVLVMEWLATLMDRSGPAGALRAVNNYEDVGWISRDVRDRLVDVIGGPGLDVFVDPTQPREPTADEHAVSYEYLRVLDELAEV